ncbi:alanyl-tRNA editing protein [Candidatus Woesearchaeota archaeon]|nr:alanyl-tRNA editing protein [Candidatus Woesearchaeota archaeon]
MKDQALYMHDSYLKEFEAVVESVKDEKYVVLDKTAFYPKGGGQPNDTGTIIKDGQEFPIVFVGKFDNKISHEVSVPGLKAGDKVTGKIDWERRYRLMRMHTTAHLLSAVLHNKSGAMITGGDLDTEKSRIDFSLEDFDRGKLDEYCRLANEIIKNDLPVKVSFMKREEALKIPGMVKLAGALPPEIDEWRIVEIEGVDRQADGGTHVKSLKEIGQIEILKVDNKGKNNRRVYYKVT